VLNARVPNRLTRWVKTVRGMNAGGAPADAASPG